MFNWIRPAEKIDPKVEAEKDYQREQQRLNRHLKKQLRDIGEANNKHDKEVAQKMSKSIKPEKAEEEESWDWAEQSRIAHKQKMQINQVKRSDIAEESLDADGLDLALDMFG